MTSGDFSKPEPPGWRLGSFHVYPSRHLIEGPWEPEGALGASERRISPKAMAVLVALSERPGEVWTKQQLLELVWEERYVTEGVLHNAVTELRQALDDNPRQPWAIETIYGAGYRLLVMPSEPAGPGEAAGDSPGPAQGLFRLPRPRWRWLALVVAACAVVLAVGREGLHAWCRGDAGAWVVSDAASCGSLRAFRVAKAALAKGEEEAAKGAFQSVVELDPAFVHAWYYLANLYDRRDSKDRAREKVAAGRAAAARKGPYYEALLARREAQIDGHWEKERDELEDLRSWDRTNPEWPLGLGFGYIRHRSDCDNGLEFHREAWALGNESPYGRYYCEAAARCLGERSALGICRQILETDGGSVETLLLVAEVELSAGNLAAAEIHARAAQNLRDGDSSALLTLGEIAYLRRDLDLAQRLFAAAARGNLDDDFDERALRRLGDLWLEKGQLDQARAVAERMSRLREPSFETVWLRGRVGLASGRMDQAREELAAAREEATAAESRYQVEWLEELEGWIELAEHRPDAAARAFERALDFGPRKATRVRTALAKALAAAGERDRARKLLESVLADQPAYWPAEVALEELAEAPAGDP